MKTFFDRFFNDTVVGYTASAEFIGPEVTLLSSEVSTTNTEYTTLREFTFDKDGFYFFLAPFYGTNSRNSTFLRVLVNENVVFESIDLQVIRLNLKKGDNVKFQLRNSTSNYTGTLSSIRYIKIDNVIFNTSARTNNDKYSVVIENFIPDRTGRIMLLYSRNSYDDGGSNIKVNGESVKWNRHGNMNVFYTVIQVYASIPVNITTNSETAISYVRAFVEEEYYNGRKIVKSIQRGFVSGTPGYLKGRRIQIGEVNPLKTMVFLDSGSPSVLYVGGVEKNALVIGSRSDSTDSTNDTTIHYQIVEFW